MLKFYKNCLTATLLTLFIIKAIPSNGKNPNFVGTVNDIKAFHTQSFDTPSDKYQLTKGLFGKAIKVGIENGKALNYKYPAMGKIKTKAGSIAFWVKPVDWDGADTSYHHILLEANSADTRMLIYKYANYKKLYFLWQSWKNKENLKVTCDISKWQKGQWHFVVCSWGQKGLSIYVDGDLKDFSSISQLPPATFDNIIVGGKNPWTKKGLSLIDDLRIYNIKLPDDVINRKYRKYISTIVKKKQNFRVTLDKTNIPPVIDGNIEKDKYRFEGTGFIDIMSGDYASLQGNYYLSYDSNNLYVAVETPVVNNNLTAYSKGRDGSVWEDDSIELHLSHNKENKYFQFIFNSIGTVFDKKGGNTAWNCPGLKFANKRTKNKWVLELSIPFSSLDCKKPVDGQKWGINICRTFNSPVLYSCVAPVIRRAYKNKESFIEVLFSKQIPTVYIDSLGNLSGGECAVKMRIKNDTKTSMDVSADIMLMSGVNKVIDFKKKNYQIKKNQQLEINLPKKKLDGNNNILVMKMSSKTTPLYQGSFAFTVTKDFSLLQKHIIPYKGKLVCEFQQKELTYNGEPVINTIIIYDKKKKEVLKKSFVSKKAKYKVDIDISKLKAGEYDIYCKLHDKKNKVLGTIKDYLKKLSCPPAWGKNSIGIVDYVPKPWTPMSYDNNTINCWGRKYIFEKSGIFLSQMISQGKKMLNASMQIKAVINGTKYSITKPKRSWKIRKDNKAELVTTGELGPLKVSASCLIEYDGEMWISLKLMAKKIPLTVEKLFIDIPLKKQYATLINTSFHVLVQKTGSFSKKMKTVDINLTPDFWVGNSNIGLQWFAEDTDNWYVKDSSKKVEAIHQDKSVTIRLNLINDPLAMRGERKISFGLMSTPVKPKARGWRSWRFSTNPKHPKSTLTLWCVMNKVNYPDAKKIYPRGLELLKQYRANNKKVTPYFSFSTTNAKNSEWQYFSELWRRKPQKRNARLCVIDSAKKEYLQEFCPNSKDYQNFFLWKLKNYLTDLKKMGLSIDGLYFDFGHVRFCNNKLHGCGLKSQRTYYVRGAREFIKRIYVLMKEYDSEALILFHGYGSVCPAVHSFVSGILEGEVFHTSLQRDKSYYKILSLDRFRAHSMLNQIGPVGIFLPQFKQLFFSKNAQKQRKYWATTEGIRAINHLKGLVVAHNIKCCPAFGVNMNKIWDVQKAFGWDNKVKFILYMNNQKYLKVISPISKNIVVSIYKRMGKVMLVPLNNTDKNIEIKIKLNLKELGLVSNSDNPIIVVDKLNGAKVKLKGNILSMSLEKRSFAMLFMENQ